MVTLGVGLKQAYQLTVIIGPDSEGADRTAHFLCHKTKKSGFSNKPLFGADCPIYWTWRLSTIIRYHDSHRPTGLLCERGLRHGNTGLGDERKILTQRYQRFTDVHSPGFNRSIPQLTETFGAIRM